MVAPAPQGEEVTVRELIANLERMPPDLDVRVWDGDEDDWAPVTEVLYEDGTSAIDLLTGERT